MTAPILVTGGTGTLGGLVVPRLIAAGQSIRLLSRHTHEGTDRVEYTVGDLATGQGVAAALHGIYTVVHLAGGPKGDDVLARTLVGAARDVHHLVYISVVGCDRVPMSSAMDRAMFGYFGGKRAAELIVEESGIPSTTLRAAQFHELSFTTVESIARLPVVLTPSGIRFQPIDADEVAARLVELALGAPAGLVADMGGPTSYTLADMARGYLRATGRMRPILQLPVPGKAAAALRAGALLTPEHAVGRRTWEEFLADRVAAAGK